MSRYAHAWYTCTWIRAKFSLLLQDVPRYLQQTAGTLAQNGERRSKPRKFTVGNAYLWIRDSGVWIDMDKGHFYTWISSFCVFFLFCLFYRCCSQYVDGFESLNLCNHVCKKLLSSSWRRYVHFKTVPVSCSAANLPKPKFLRKRKKYSEETVQCYTTENCCWKRVPVDTWEQSVDWHG